MFESFVGLAEGNFKGPPRKFPAPIYIHEDGTIEGAEEILERTGNAYFLTRNTSKTIHILRDDIIFNGNGFSLTAPSEANPNDTLAVGGSDSIRIYNRTNIQIINTKFVSCDISLNIRVSSNITVIQNTITNSVTHGIYMDSCTNCSIIGNNIVDNSSPGLFIMDASYLNLAYNKISRNRSHGGWLTVSYSNISRNDITDNLESPTFGIGLYMYGPNSHNRIFENNFINNYIGLFYQGSRNTRHRQSSL